MINTELYKLAELQNWDTLEQFKDWYTSFNLPLAMPSEFEVYESDDALSFPLFRYKNFQVELYVLYNPIEVPVHSHPYVEVIQASFNKDGIQYTPKLIYPDSHGSATFKEVFDARENRLLLLTFEKWPVNSTPSTIAAVWKGVTAGPKQEALVKRFFPNAYVVKGYADITRTSNE
jgi:hypothetical protein